MKIARWQGLFLLVVCAVGAGEPPVLSVRMTLEEALGVAMTNHPKIIAARETVEAAEANYGGSFSSYYPQVSGLWSYRRTISSGSKDRKSVV